MKKLFTILAMVATLAMVGCEKDGKGGADKPLTLEGSQWEIVGQSMTLEEGVECSMYYDVGCTEKGKIIGFVVVNKTTADSSFFVGDAFGLMSWSYTAGFDDEGNMIRYESDGEIVNVTMFDKDNALLSIQGEDDVALRRVATPYKYQMHPQQL